jgi:AraC family transcriptional regulator of adaptative response/methylated-DNA-[protein]-cysteine methyltransferase
MARTSAAAGRLGDPRRQKVPARDIRYAVGESSLGSVLVAQGSGGICAILLGDDPDTVVRELRARFPMADLRGGDREFGKIVAGVIALIERPQARVELPLDLRGTVFQRRVWRALRKIPPGATASYSEVAARIGAPKAVRAVAQACAANPLAVAIPCHRIVRRDGGLSGYRWGEERKRALLAREARA